MNTQPPLKDTVKVVMSAGHGKCVKGGKKTSTVQVRNYCVSGGYLLEGQFRFKVGDKDSESRAWNAARVFAERIRGGDGGCPVKAAPEPVCKHCGEPKSHHRPGGFNCPPKIYIPNHWRTTTYESVA